MSTPLRTEAELEVHLRTLIGLSVEIMCTAEDGERLGIGPTMLIEVRRRTDGQVEVGNVEGWGMVVTLHELSIIVGGDPPERDRMLFTDCHQRGYYCNLPLNERLRTLVTV